MSICADGDRLRARTASAVDKEVMMPASESFTIGSAVSCSDGPCGTLTQVVVDPLARSVTHLVVEPEHRSGLGRLVPLALVDADADGDGVRLRCTFADFEDLPHAEETDFLPGGSGYEAYQDHELFYWPFYGLEGGSDPAVTFASGLVTRDTLPPGEVAVRRGERVHAADGEIGKVEGLVVEPTNGHVTHVLLQEGHMWGRKRVAIPLDAVVHIDDGAADGITVSLTKQEIEDLPEVDVRHPTA
jgi:sporulation protein YlmC with PRC-barrel domain